MLKGREKFVQIPGFILAIKEWGNENGVPIVALHGWLDNADSFAFLAPLLPQYRFIAIDSPGCGHSSHRGLGHYPSIVEETFYVLQAIKALSIESFILLGHSRGAAISQLIASGAPSFLQALILIDNISFSPQPILDTWRRTLKAAMHNKPRPATIYRDLDDAIKGRMQAGVISYESAKALTLRGTKQTKDGRVWTFDRREMLFFHPMPIGHEQTVAIMNGIETPTCIILAQDGLMDEDKREARARLIPNHELHVIPGNHHVHMDDPHPVAQIVIDFLERKL